MNPIKLYTVKEAAKLIGVSTNTLYKYLDEGRLKAARGSAEQGRFRIPESALEDFLGIKLTPPPEILTNQLPESPVPLASSTVVSTSNPRLPLKITRFLLALALLATLFEVIMSPSLNPPALAARLLVLIPLLILAYQDGGFRRVNV